MKFLVTGGLGFIGSNFILYLLSKKPKAKIINLDACLSGSNKKNLSVIRNNHDYKFVRGNICDKYLVDRLVSQSDIIINFAAESHVDRSIVDAKPFIDSNIVGVNILLAAIKKYKKRFIQISTDEVFGSLTKGSANEDYQLNPSSPYAASKASAELLVNSYVNTYDCDAIITRCTNNFGPRQSPEKLIPKVILLAEQNKMIPIYGAGKNVRDWIFVLDHCEAISKVMLKGKRGSSYNISSGNELDNMTIVRKILEIIGRSDDLITHVKDRPGHDFRYSLNSRKIRAELHWKPVYDFKTGLENTIEWYVNNKEWRKNISTRDMIKVSWKTR